jgi:hypothetical protein
MPRTESTSKFEPLENKGVEYFFASDASAVIEHTNRVIFLEVNSFANNSNDFDMCANNLLGNAHFFALISSFTVHMFFLQRIVFLMLFILSMCILLKAH